jgi:hypothetical protein
VAYARRCVDAVAVTLSPASGRLAGLYAAELPQMDNLCGAFWAMLALRAAGGEEALGEPVDQELVAREAGAILPAGGDPASWLPPGARPRDDYRIALARSEDGAITGTSEPGLARAIERIAGGALRALPVAGPWTADGLVAALEAIAATAPDATVMANWRTAPLWGSHAPVTAVLEALAAGDAADPPPPDWDVGHWVGIAAVARGPGGAVVLVRDTYRELGADGHHVQPAARAAAALARGDGSEGGLLVVAPPDQAAAAEDRLRGLGLELRHWDNGTPDGGRET